MKAKTNNILALLTCTFIIFASFWCMEHPTQSGENGLASVLAEDRTVELNPGGWDLDGNESNLIINNESAQEVGIAGDQKLYTSEEGGIIGFLNRTVNFAVMTIGSLAILGVVVGGTMMIVGSMKGNTEGVEFGKNAVIYSLIGLALVFLSYFIVSTLQVMLYS